MPRKSRKPKPVEVPGKDPLTKRVIREKVYEHLYNTKEPTRLERTLLTLQEKSKHI